MSRWLGQRHIHHAATTSTMDDALALVATEGCAAHGTVITAAAQSAGRGRRGRRWEGAGNQLLLSMIVCSKRSELEHPFLALVAGLGVADLVETFGGQPRIKWPNDVLVHDRKLAGILLEGRGNGALVVGIGINRTRVHQHVDLKASALSDLAKVDETEILTTLLDALEQRIDAFEQFGPSVILAPLRDRLAWRGENVSCDDVHGVIEGIDDRGRLLLRTSKGIHPCVSGTVRRTYLSS